MRVAWTTLLTLAAVRLLFHILTNGHYGFHRDELATFDDARHLDWGFVAYPPLTPFLARIGLDVFGTSPAGVRAIPALAQSLVMLVAGWMAALLGGGRRAQVLAALAVAASPVSLAAGHLFQYVSFDLLWGAITLACVIQLLQTDNPRWWIPIGITVGLGLMTRYTIAFLVVGAIAGLLISRRFDIFRTRWFPVAALLTICIALPNLLWQARNDYVSLDFLRSIHERDVRIGRADGFLWKQFLVPANLLTVPLWLAGLWFYFRRPEGSRLRALGWTFVATLLLFAISQARDYYTAPLYPMLLAAGAVLSDRWPKWARGAQWAGVAAGIAVAAAIATPLAPSGTAWFQTAANINGDLREEFGWQELAAQIAQVRDLLPEDERASAAILTDNYGEAGALDLYGGKFGLPGALSRVNSYWLRGYPEERPQTLILVGFRDTLTDKYFMHCEVMGTITNPIRTRNEEFGRVIRVCRDLKLSWKEFWAAIKAWG
jgi:hypothetical protein